MIDNKPHTADNYLKKYRDKYKVFKQQGGVWEIRCKRGNSVCVYDLGDRTLLFAFFSGKSARSVNLLIKKLQQCGVWFKVNQLGDTEATIIFKEDDIEKFELIFKIKKRKIISEEYRKILVERMKVARESKKR